MNPTDTLEQRLVSSAPVRIVLPEGWEEARLVAGYRGLGRVKLRPAPLRGLLGLGETLLVMKRRPAPDGPPSLLPLAGHVVDHGQVAECESLGEARFRLRLTSNLAIEEDTHVLAWPAQGAPSLLPFTVRTDERGKGLDVEVVSPPRALGLINRGYWLGAWWFDGWEQQLESCGIDAQQALLLLRWLRLPLLQHPDPVRAFALAHMTDTMLAWGGLPQYQPGDLHLASGAVLPLSLSTNEYWAAARKELLEDMPPLTPSLARDIRKEIYWNRLHQPQARALAPLFDALFRFSASFPALLEQALRDDLQHSWSIQFRKCALKVPNNCSFKPKDQRTYRTTRLSEFCSETGMHRARVEPLLQVSPEGLTTQQRMLLHLEGFARLLADTLCS